MIEHPYKLSDKSYDTFYSELKPANILKTVNDQNPKTFYFKPRNDGFYGHWSEMYLCASFIHQGILPTAFGVGQFLKSLTKITYKMFRR